MAHHSMIDGPPPQLKRAPVQAPFLKTDGGDNRELHHPFKGLKHKALQASWFNNVAPKWRT